MLDEIKVLQKEVDAFTPKNKKELEIFRIKFLAKKGIINNLFDVFKPLQRKTKKN